MADPATFIAQYSQNIQTLVNTLYTLQRQNQQLSDDSSLVTSYFALPSARKDIAATDVSNAQSAIVQMLFAYNSGTPTQAQFLLKMMP